MVPGGNKENVIEMEVEYGSPIDVDMRSSHDISDQLSEYQLVKDKDKRPQRKLGRYESSDESIYSMQGKSTGLIDFAFNIAFSVCYLEP